MTLAYKIARAENVTIGAAVVHAENRARPQRRSTVTDEPATHRYDTHLNVLYAPAGGGGRAGAGRGLHRTPGTTRRSAG